MTTLEQRQLDWTTDRQLAFRALVGQVAWARLKRGTDLVNANDHERTNRVACADCGRYEVHHAWGLCGSCYYRHRYHGTLAQFGVGS